MDLKKSPSNRRGKRSAGGSGGVGNSSSAATSGTSSGLVSSGTATGSKNSSEQENHWDCSVCTYRNTFDAFKCLMCDVRKGTSTRKPRINQVAQQFNQQFNQAGVKKKSEKKTTTSRVNKKKVNHLRKLRNVDRNTAETREVTVNNVTVLITEYKPKSVAAASGSLAQNNTDNSGSESEAPSADSDSRSSMIKLSIN